MSAPPPNATDSWQHGKVPSSTDPMTEVLLAQAKLPSRSFCPDNLVHQHLTAPPAGTLSATIRHNMADRGSPIQPDLNLLFKPLDGYEGPGCHVAVWLPASSTTTATTPMMM
jgi:hypothetical protein